MIALWAPLLLIGIAAIPLVPAFVWFRVKQYGTFRFLFAAAAGVCTVLLAGLVQSFFPAAALVSDQAGLRSILFGVFIRVALVEELSRAVLLLFLFNVFPFSRIPAGSNDPQSFFGAPSGLTAGLGFAAGESIFYSLIDFRIALLRIFTAAPLHAACGARVGNALGIAGKHPVTAVIMFITAFFIHGVYNFCIQNQGIPWLLSVFIALTALISSLVNIYYGEPGHIKRGRTI